MLQWTGSCRGRDAPMLGVHLSDCICALSIDATRHHRCLAVAAEAVGSSACHRLITESLIQRIRRLPCEVAHSVSGCASYGDGCPQIIEGGEAPQYLAAAVQ